LLLSGEGDKAMARAYRRKAPSAPEETVPTYWSGIVDTFSQMIKPLATGLPISPISTSPLDGSGFLSPDEVSNRPFPSIAPTEGVPLRMSENPSMEPTKRQKKKDVTDFATAGEAKLNDSTKKKEAAEGAAPAAPSASEAVPAPAESTQKEAAPAAAKQYLADDIPLEEVPHTEPEVRSRTRSGRATVEKKKPPPTTPVPDRLPVED
jgi:hypothetical protein